MIEVIDFKSNPTFMRSGFVYVKYYKSTWVCEVCFVKDKDFIWIRLPAVRDHFHKNKTHNVVNFDERSDSEEFQVSVLLQLSRKFPDALKRPNLTKVRRDEKHKKKAWKKYNPEEAKKREAQKIAKLQGKR